MAEAVVDYLAPVRERYESCAATRRRSRRRSPPAPSKARAIAAQTLADVRHAHGRRPRVSPSGRCPSLSPDARRRPRARPRRLRGPVRPAADARPARGGRPARGRPGRRRPRLPRPPRGARRARPRGGDRVPRPDRRAAGAEVAADAAARGEEGCSSSSPPRRPRSCWRGCSSTRRFRGAAEALRERLEAERGFRYRSAPLPPAAAARLARPRRGGLRPRRCSARRSAACCACRRRSTSAHVGDAEGQRRRAARAPALAAAPRALHLRRGGRGRRPRDRRHDAVRAARALQARRGDVGAGRAVRDDRRRARASAAPAPSRDGGDARERPAADLRGAAVPLARAGDASPTSPRRARSPRRGARQALEALAERLAEGERGLVLREIAGGYTLASRPRSPRRPRAGCWPSRARRRSRRPRPRRSRSSPTCSRSRGRRSRASAASTPSRRRQTLLERGLIEEAGRSQFGAVLYRTTDLFLKLFGLDAIDDLPDLAQWDPTPGGGGRSCAIGCCGPARRAPLADDDLALHAGGLVAARRGSRTRRSPFLSGRPSRARCRPGRPSCRPCRRRGPRPAIACGEARCRVGFFIDERDLAVGRPDRLAR